MEAAQEIDTICKYRYKGLPTRPQSHCCDFVGLADRLSASNLSLMCVSSSPGVIEQKND